MTQEIANNNAILTNIAKAKPIVLALARSSLGKCPTKMAIKIILSMPRTISMNNRAPKLISVSSMYANVIDF